MFFLLNRAFIYDKYVESSYNMIKKKRLTKYINSHIFKNINNGNIDMNTEIKAIDKRYSALAGQDCCLSCGKALEKAAVSEGDICLDLGSGRGTDVIRMAEMAGVGGFAYGLDISDGMLEKAAKTAEMLGVKNVKFLKSQLEQIPLETSIVDVVISNCTLNHASDKKKVWKEIYRVLKPDGLFTVSDIYSTAPVPEKYANDPQAVAECWAGAVTRQEYFNILEEAGFRSVEILEESAPYPKGEIEVASFTIRGYKNRRKLCCSRE